MQFVFPSADDFKAYFVRDFPYAVPAVGAAGTAVLTGTALSAITRTAAGSGYTEEPQVMLVPKNGGPGAGATATAQVQAGVVTGFTVTAPGTGYTQPPDVIITGGAGDDTNLEKVTSADLNKALFEAKANFNPCLFPTQDLFTMAFLYLAAHYLVNDLVAGMQGVGSTYNWLTTSKTVGNVSESFQIPDSILRSPLLSYYSTTRYGAKYLSIISPLLVGNIAPFFRQTLP